MGIVNALSGRASMMLRENSLPLMGIVNGSMCWYCAATAVSSLPLMGIVNRDHDAQTASRWSQLITPHGDRKRA